MMFGYQTSKNVHDIQNVCLEMTLCVFVCFVEFNVFIFDEIVVGGPNLICGHIFLRDIWENILKD